MRFKKVFSMFGYVGWFLKHYSSEQNTQNNFYRIVEVNQISPTQYKLSVQVIGKSVIFECDPHELVAHDQLLEGFSKKDVRMITYLACKEDSKMRYRIIRQEFGDHCNKILYKIKKYDNEEIISKTAGQLILDKILMNNISREDACSISYIAGYEQSFVDEHIIKK